MLYEASHFECKQKGSEFRQCTLRCIPESRKEHMRVAGDCQMTGTFRCEMGYFDFLLNWLCEQVSLQLSVSYNAGTACMTQVQTAKPSNRPGEQL